MWKFIVRERDELNVAKWHTNFGFLIYVAGIVCSVLGVEFGYLELESSPPWGVTIIVRDFPCVSMPSTVCPCFACVAQVLTCILAISVVYSVLRGPVYKLPLPDIPMFTYIEPTVAVN
jgi:hypothetical protein